MTASAGAAVLAVWAPSRGRRMGEVGVDVSALTPALAMAIVGALCAVAARRPGCAPLRAASGLAP